MYVTRVSTLAVAGATIASLGLTAAPVANAAPAPAAATGITQAAAAAPALKSSRMDVDGDLKRDTTTLTRTGSIRRGYTYTITVRTARGATATKAFRVEDGGENPSYVWEGLAGLDGVRGAEIVVNSSPVGDSVPLTVYTWRGGKLVEQPRPGATSRSSDKMWTLVNAPWMISGYTFYTDRSGRHVTAHNLKPAKQKGKVSGTHTTYTWSKRSNTWVRTATRSSGIISDAYAQQKFAGIFGVEFS